MLRHILEFTHKEIFLETCKGFHAQFKWIITYQIYIKFEWI